LTSGNGREWEYCLCSRTSLKFQRNIEPVARTITDYTNPIPTRLARTPIFLGHGNRRNEWVNACKYSDFVASIGIEQLIKERQQSFRGIYEPVSRAWLANRELYARRRQRPASMTWVTPARHASLVDPILWHGGELRDSGRQSVICCDRDHCYLIRHWQCMAGPHACSRCMLDKAVSRKHFVFCCCAIFLSFLPRCM